MASSASIVMKPVEEHSAWSTAVLGKEDPEVESLLAAIPGDSPAGTNSTIQTLYGDLETFRKTEDSEGPLGTLREGEARTADWTKVLSIARGAIVSQSKDLGLAFYFTEGAGRKNSLKGITQGLNLVRGLCQRYWMDMYPKLADGLEMRAVWLEKLDLVLPKIIGEVQVTNASDNKAWVFWQWQGLDIERQHANKNRNADDRSKAVAEVAAKKQQFDQAMANTETLFYERLYREIHACSEACERLREIVDERLRSEPTVRELEELPGFLYTRKALKELFALTDQVLRSKGIDSPSKILLAEDAKSGATVVVANPIAESNGVIVHKANAVRGEELTREAAIAQLNTMHRSLLKTKPHSPVATR